MAMPQLHKATRTKASTKMVTTTRRTSSQEPQRRTLSTDMRRRRVKTANKARKVKKANLRRNTSQRRRLTIKKPKKLTHQPRLRPQPKPSISPLLNEKDLRS
jgi:hypothetical protein